MRVANSLLLKDDKILLLFKQSRQKWFLPGGKAEFSEMCFRQVAVNFLKRQD